MLDNLDIDVVLLKRQKNALVMKRTEIRSKIKELHEEDGLYSGIIHLLDAIQDSIELERNHA